MTMSRPFNKILIANRGEIAVRVMRTCQEMGIETVGVYSQADKEALHTRLADEAVFIGAAEPSESYLSIEKIIEAAKKTGADGVHPGYGFLSENAEFAAAVATAGLVFIGPSAETIRLMGDKAEARALMEKAGVPVAPGYQGKDDEAALKKAAKEIGYPILVKPAAGGGGKGMRVVTEAKEFGDSLAAARREAENAFGDQRMILEKYLTNARHIEFQVLADKEGTTTHLFERECSIQRRHQKIIEETPSPFLDVGLRKQMGDAALAAAKTAGYTNAGTVEFIVDAESREFYFLEMNTRLQVEHPTTELTTGLDLVQWQIRIAAGEKLPFKQDELSPRGHALECRIYAEDPGNGFLPATGTLHKVVEPGGPGVRVDSGVVQGMEVGVHYDPLLAKVIVVAEDRARVIRKMKRALQETVFLGLTTNREFLLAVIAHPGFMSGIVSTTFVDHEFIDWKPKAANGAPVEILIAAAIAEMEGKASLTGDGDHRSEDDEFSPWARGMGFRMGGGG